MSLFGSLFGGKSGRKPGGGDSGDGGAVDSADRALIRADIGRLDTVDPGLGSKLVAYICEGEHGSALLTLASVKADAAKILKPTGWSSAGAWIPGRSDFLLGARAWRPDTVRRYGEVLAPIYDGARWPPLPGTDRSPAWLRTVVMQYGESRAAITGPQVGKPPAADRLLAPWTLDRLRGLLDDDETPVLDLAFERDDGWWSRNSADRGSPEQMPGFEDHLRSDPPRRAAEMRGLSAKARAYGLRTLARLGLVDGAWFDLAFEQAGDAAKSAREAAALILRAAPPAALADRTRDAWPKMRTAQKIEIARIVAAACGDAAPGLLGDLAEVEKIDSVRAELQRHRLQGRAAAHGEVAREDGPDGYTALDGAWIAAPPPSAPPEDPPVSTALRARISRLYAIVREEAERHNRERAGGKYFHKQPVPPADADDRACLVMEGRSPKGPLDRSLAHDLFWSWGGSKARAAAVVELLGHPDLTLWHLARCLDEGGPGRQDLRAASIFFETPLAKAMQNRLGPRRDLRVYDAIIASFGWRPGSLVRHLLGDSYWRPDLDAWPSEAVWSCCAAAFPLIDEALGLVPPSGKETLVEGRALEALASFPATPARYFSALLDRALGDRKLVRQPARDLLATAPDLDRLLIPLLKHPKAETRAGTATWLAERGSVGAVGALLDAARVEALPGPKAALLGAISRLGGDIRAFVSPGVLLAEAEAGLRKAAPKGLDWFPFDGLPPLKAAVGDPLDARVVRWWIVLAAKLKQPGGNPWFDLLLDELDPAGAAALCRAVMSAWVAHDTARPSEDEANAYAAQHVAATLAQYQRWKPETTHDQIFAMLRQTKLGQYLHSGNDSKGVLALATRASAAEAVAIARAYLRDHYPRTAQCKALLECLAANPSPVATQYVLSISKRWRTRTVQDLAAELVTGIADRRGWTADQLADRTVPTGGLDEAGCLELPVGDRVFAARLDAGGALTLFNAEGNPVKALPASASGEAAESLKAAKATLSGARKEIKQVFDFQTRRLYEALCVGRAWPAAEWADFLLHHPLVGRLAQRLVWLGFDAAGGRIVAFRPMEDLSLTDPADGAVTLDGVATIRIAHSTALSDAERSDWRRHLQDYEVKPLFDLFGRETLVADGLPTDASEIVDRRGWIIEAFKLRGTATRLGYTRGPAEDGGWFLTYQKTFDSLRLAAVVEFTGNVLPEENRVTALKALRFVRMGKGPLRWDKGVTLGAVPPVLLSEAWNDFHQMAAAGTGFDAEWEQTAAW